MASELPSWKIVPQASTKEPQFVVVSSASKYFAIDASGSTGGAPLRSEEDFVMAFHNNSGLKSKNCVTKWGSRCQAPTYDWNKFVWRSDQGGTSPSAILQQEMSLGAIHSSDIFFLLTDGEVWQEEVYNLARLCQQKQVFNVPTVFLITSYNRGSPSQADVSVGITSYANCPDAVCLFKDYKSGTIYVMAAKGCFAALDKATVRDNWEDLTNFASETELIGRIDSLGIKVATADTRPLAMMGLDLGAKWNAAHKQKVLLDTDELFKSKPVDMEDLELLLGDETVDSLILACKSWGKLRELRTWLQSQRVEQVNVTLQDVSGASAIIAELGKSDNSAEKKAELQKELRAAHAANQEHYLKELNDNSSGESARARNRLVDSAMANLAEVEKAGFTADVLDRRSNRARRADQIATGTPVEVSSLDFNTAGFRADCEICCGEEEVMSLALKVLDKDNSAANTADFALDFPLAAGRFPWNENIISSQCICFQCALFGRPGYSMVGEPLSAIIPTLEYSGGNKMYMNQELYMALNGGLKTGVPQLGQLFATIIDRTLQTKEWAGAIETEIVDPEIEKRRRALSYLLETVLASLRVRETFNEQGKWCAYPEALAWAVKNFEEEGLTSWAINYPVSGFMQLIRFGTLLRVFTKEQVQKMKATKLIHSFVSTYLARLFKEASNRRWTQELLAMVYSDFNADLIPKDLGANSVLNDVEEFWKLLCEFLKAEPAILDGWETEAKKSFMPRIQVLAFWLIYFQLAHTSTKTYFLRIRETEPLAGTLLDEDKLPKKVVDEVLLSPFLEKDKFLNKKVCAEHSIDFIPFSNPFGASVLKCGHPNCNVSFVPQELKGKDLKKVEWTPQLLDKVRQGRRLHLIQAFGVEKTFEENQTGLPEPTKTPNKPTSNHTPMHISIARVWARVPRDERKSIAMAIDASFLDSQELQDFVGIVIMEICQSHRGDVFNPNLRKEILEILPSFMTALRKALFMQHGKSVPISSYNHNFEENKMENKVKYEISITI